jgi:uncharacterized RDD family membrane protein YckC
MAGAGSVAAMTHQAPLGEQQYAGQRLGLPEEGPRSVAGWGRRVVALLVDWTASWLVALAFFGTAVAREPVTMLDLFAVPLIAWAQTTLLTTLLGGSFGQLALRVVVVRLDGQRVNLLQAMLRSVLKYLLIPPVVFNRDNRGLHDLAVGTITVLR